MKIVLSSIVFVHERFTDVIMNVLLNAGVAVTARVAFMTRITRITFLFLFLLQLIPLTTLVQLLITEVITTYNSNTITSITYTT